MDQTENNNVVDLYLRPYIERISWILIEEDKTQRKEPGSIGDCLEYMIRHNVFMDITSLAQLDNPKGLFPMCMTFVMEMLQEIKAMALIHNDKVHRSLTQISRNLHSQLKNDIVDINE